MVFKKKFNNYYLAKLWKHYETIPQTEVNTIIKTYGKKPMSKIFYENLERIIYDETAEKEKPEYCGKYCAFWQIAIYRNTLFVRKISKHINRCSKTDLLTFKLNVEFLNRIRKGKSYLVSDMRFRRMRLSAKDFKIFKRIEHNQIHRIISTFQKLHYNGKKYSKDLWIQTAKSHKLNVVFL